MDVVHTNRPSGLDGEDKMVYVSSHKLRQLIGHTGAESDGRDESSGVDASKPVRGIDTLVLHLLIILWTVSLQQLPKRVTTLRVCLPRVCLPTQGPSTLIHRLHRFPVEPVQSLLDVVDDLHCYTAVLPGSLLCPLRKEDFAFLALVVLAWQYLAAMTMP